MRQREEIQRRYGHDPTLVAEVESLLDQSEAVKREGFLIPPDDEPENSPGAALPSGTRIGPYEVQERLGYGGMGAVYLARQLEGDGQLVALKLIGSASRTDTLLLRRF